MCKIPKVIHYCWFGGNEKPEFVNKCIESWKKVCPDYKIIEWNESNIDINNMNNYVKQTYENKKWAFVTDYIRLYVVYNYGGIYLDTDVELLKTLDECLEYDGFFSSEDNKMISTGLGFGALKGNKLVKKMMEDYENINYVIGKNRFDNEPCTVRNTRSLSNILNGFLNRNIINIYENNVFYPKEYFCPMDSVTKELHLTNKAFSIHYFSGTWLSDKEKRINKKREMVCKIFGEKLGKKISKLITLPYRVSKKISKLGYLGTLKFTAKKLLNKLNK